MSAYRSLVLNDEPVAYWRLGESSGTVAADATGNGHTGTYVNTPTLAQTGPLAGDPDTAVSFAAASDERVDIADHANLRPAAFSIEIWVKRSGLGVDYEVAVQKSSTSWTGEGFGLFHRPSGDIGFWVQDYTSLVSAALSLNAWHHVVGTFDGSTARLYIDGVAVGTPIAGISFTPSTFDLRIASGQSTTTYQWDGLLDEVAFYAEALSVDQIARHYAFREYTNKLYVIVDGVHRGEGRESGLAGVRMEGFVVHDPVNEDPTTCQFDANVLIAEGARVLAMYCGAPKVRFAGTVRKSTLHYQASIPDDTHWSLDCIGDEWKLNSRKVFARYVGETLTDVVLDLMSIYAPDCPVDNVTAGLPVIDEISFTAEDLTTCLTRACKRVGAYWRRDPEEEGLRVFLVDSDTVPDTVDDNNGPETLTRSRDLGPMITRMLGEGAGSRAITDVPVGETLLPIESVEHFNASGGLFKSGPQIVAYGGIEAGGEGGLVGTGALPSTAPTLGLNAGSGMTSGAHDVAVVFVTGAGRSLPGPTATLTVGTIAAPSTGPTAATPTTGGSVTAGAHYYAYIEDTPAGKTTPSPVSATVTALAEVSAPSAPVPFAGGTDRVGYGALDYNVVYGYKYTFWDGGTRETVPSSGGTFTTNGFAAWNAGAIQISTLQTPPSGFYHRFYRTEGGGSTYKLLPYGQAQGQFSEISGGYYIDIKGDVELGVAAPSADTTKRATVALSGIPLPSSAFVTDRIVCGTAAAGSQLKEIASIGLTGTTYSVTMADGSLGSNVPSSAPTANQIAASAIPIGPSGTTARELYMSAAGGGARKRALAIADNTTQTGTISMSDATLAGEMAEPVVDTSGLSQPDGQVLPGASSIEVAGAGVMPSAGWAIIGNGHQVIRFTGNSGTALTGVPASGAGAIVAAIAYNSTITAAPMLTGITTGSPTNGSIAYAIVKGDDVNLFLVENDVAAQALRASLLNDGSDGVVEDYLQNRSLSETELRDRLLAMLTQNAVVEETVDVDTRDPQSRAGGTLTVDLSDPVNVDTELAIQSVDVSQFGQGDVFPLHHVSASSRRYSLEDLLRRQRQE